MAYVNKINVDLRLILTHHKTQKSCFGTNIKNRLSIRTNTSIISKSNKKIATQKEKNVLAVH